MNTPPSILHSHFANLTNWFLYSADNYFLSANDFKSSADKKKSSANDLLSSAHKKTSSANRLNSSAYKKKSSDNDLRSSAGHLFRFFIDFKSFWHVLSGSSLNWKMEEEWKQVGQAITAANCHACFLG